MDDIQREIKERKRILNIYNKRREDFETKESWDDYLEAVEDIIYNLVNKIDLAATEAKVCAYSRSNQLNIDVNRARLAAEQKEAQQAAAQALTGPPTEPDPMGNNANIPRPFRPQGGGLVAAQPVPMSAPALGKDGRIPTQPLPLGPQFEAMALASGWTPGFTKARAIEEAFASVLLL